MVRKYCLANLGAWLVILQLTTAHGATLEKYQILQQEQAAVQQYPARQVIPGVPAYAAQTFSLYRDFAEKILSFSPEEKNKLYGNFLTEQNGAIENREFGKAKYYDQLLGIILNEMEKGVQ